MEGRFLLEMRKGMKAIAQYRERIMDGKDEKAGGGERKGTKARRHRAEMRAIRQEGREECVSTKAERHVWGTDGTASRQLSQG